MSKHVVICGILIKYMQSDLNVQAVNDLTAALVSFGLLPSSLKEKNSWMCTVGLNLTHLEQRVPEACFCLCHSQLHAIAPAVGVRSLKSTHHVHTGSPQQEATTLTSFEGSSFIYGPMDAGSFFYLNLKQCGKPSRSFKQSLLVMKASTLRGLAMHTIPQCISVC